MRFLGIFFLVSICAFGQGSTSRLVGTVSDASGAAVANAAVRLSNQGTAATFATSTTNSGAYEFESLQPGQYRVTVEAPGFRKFDSPNNVVTIGQPATVNVKLEVGNVSDSVEVSGAAQAVQTSSSANIGNVMEEHTIKDLPIVGTRGRNPLGLVDLQPGVIDTQAISGGAVVVFGARDRAWNITLDGIDNNESSSGGSNFAPLRTNPDSLEEFRVITSNPSAEYGRSSGGQVAMITKSGSNAFHGAGFEFYRTPRFNANEWQNNFNSIGKSQFVQHIFGGDIGGPIVKNKTFFFVNVQGLTALQTYGVTRTVYTAQARQGLFRYVAGGRNNPSGSPNASVDASGNVVPGVAVSTYNIVANDPLHLGLDKTTQGLVNAAPLPNAFNVGDGLNTAGYNFSAPGQERQHDITFKIDQIINATNTVYARVSWGQQNTNCDNANGGLALFPGGPCQVNTDRNPKNFAFNWRSNPTPRVTNEVILGLNEFGFIFAEPAADLNKLSFAANPPVAVPAGDFGNSRTLKTWQFVDNISYQWNAHALKFGTNLRFGREIDARGSVGSYNAATDVLFNADISPAQFNIPGAINQSNDLPSLYNSINFLLGRVSEVQRGFSAPNGQNFVSGVLPYDAHWNEYDFFAQDSWKVRRNLTVDIGLRWEIKLAPYSTNTVMSHPDQPLVGGAAPTNTVQWVNGPLFRNSLADLGPSLGFAWDPFSTGKTSIRANYRIAYDRLNSFLLSSQVFNNLPGLIDSYDDSTLGQKDTRLPSVSPVQPPAVSPSTFRAPAPFSTASITVMDPNFKIPTTHQWDFSFQREVWKGGVFEADYIGRRAYHLLGAYSANQPNLFAPGVLDAFNTVQAGGQSTMLNSLFSADSRVVAGKTASDMIRSQYSSQLSLSSYAAILSSLGTRVQSSPNGPRNVTSLSGAGAFAVIPFPQYSNVTVIDSNDFSTYNGMVLQYQQHYKNGIQFQVSYTLSKALATRDFDPTFTVVSTQNAQGASSTPFDINNRKLNYGEAQYDHRHAIQAHATIELPFGQGKAFAHGVNGTVNRIVGGWEVAPIFTYYSGRPFTVFSGSDTFGSVVQSTANCSGCSQTMGQVQDYQGYKWFFNPATQKTLFSAPAAGSLGNTGKGYFFGPRFMDIDMAFIKRIQLREAINLELRADATNLTNTPSFGLPTATLTSPLFGRIGSSVESGSRKFQMGAKLNF
jgi:hypothetical protein